MISPINVSCSLCIQFHMQMSYFLSISHCYITIFVSVTLQIKNSEIQITCIQNSLVTVCILVKLLHFSELYLPCLKDRNKTVLIQDWCAHSTRKCAKSKNRGPWCQPLLHHNNTFSFITFNNTHHINTTPYPSNRQKTAWSAPTLPSQEQLFTAENWRALH